MKFSIITCVNNNCNTLEDAVKSVLMQRDIEIEYIFIDGGSTDGSKELIENWKFRIENERFDEVNSDQGRSNKVINYKVISERITSDKGTKFIDIKFVSENDNGIYDALNKGIKMATGDIIGIVHSDDFYNDENILKDVEQTFTRTSCDAVYGDLDYISKDDTNKIIRKWKSGKFSFMKIYFGWMPPHPTLFLKKEIFEKYGYYNTSLKIAADYELILRFFFLNRINVGYCEKIITKMRVGGKSNRGIEEILLKSKEDLVALKINRVPFRFFVLVCKNVRKIGQFLK